MKLSHDTGRQAGAGNMEDGIWCPYGQFKNRHETRATLGPWKSCTQNLNRHFLPIHSFLGAGFGLPLLHLKLNLSIIPLPLKFSSIIYPLSSVPAFILPQRKLCYYLKMHVNTCLHLYLDIVEILFCLVLFVGFYCFLIVFKE